MLYYGLEWHSLDSYFQFKEITAPDTPQASEIRLYAKDSSGTSTLCYKNDAGTEVCLPTTGPIVTGSGTSGRIAKWTGTSTLGDFTPTAGSVLFAGTSGIGQEDNANFFWDDTNNRLGIGTATPGVNLHIQPGVAADSRIRLWSGGAASRSSVEVGRTAADTSLSTAGANSEFSDIVAAAGESVLRATTSNLILTARNASGVIKFATGAADTEKFRIGSSGQWGIGGATFGTSLDVFTSGGASAAPTWTAPGALTKTDDTNVTLTLGGTPTTALLRAASLTLGWTGTLAVARGGTGQSTVAGYNALLDHGALLGLSDDDHTQYALLAGRSGGQTFIGGTAAADDLTLRATSGVGVGSEAIIFQLGSNGALGAGRFSQAGSQGIFSINTLSTDSVMNIVNTNASAPIASFIGDGASPNVNFNRYVAGVGGTNFTFNTARGTSASPTATQGGDIVFAVLANAHDGSAFANGAQINMSAPQTWTGSNHPTQIDFQTTAVSSTTPAIQWRMEHNGRWTAVSSSVLVDLSAISAGNPKIKFSESALADASTTWTAGVPSNNPSSLLRVQDSGGNTRFIPCWT